MSEDSAPGGRRADDIELGRAVAVLASEMSELRTGIFSSLGRIERSTEKTFEKHAGRLDVLEDFKTEIETERRVKIELERQLADRRRDKATDRRDHTAISLTRTQLLIAGTGMLATVLAAIAAAGGHIG